MIETIIEVCKENPYRDYETGRYTFGPSNGGNDSDIDVILEVGERKPTKRNSLVIPDLILPKKEYAMVMQELRTNMRPEHRHCTVFSRTIGNATYTIESVEEGEYRILRKKPIDE